LPLCGSSVSCQALTDEAAAATAKMRAVQMTRAGGSLELVEREVPEPARGEVRVRIEACGVFSDGRRVPLDRERRARFRFLTRAHARARRITPKHEWVADALLKRLGEDGQCDPSHATLAADTGVSDRTVRRATAQMQALGLLRWETRLVRAGWRAEQTSRFCRKVGFLLRLPNTNPLNITRLLVSTSAINRTLRQNPPLCLAQGRDPTKPSLKCCQVHGGPLVARAIIVDTNKSRHKILELPHGCQRIVLTVSRRREVNKAS
jgi:hypothetical protein